MSSVTKKQVVVIVIQVVERQDVLIEIAIQSFAGYDQGRSGPIRHGGAIGMSEFEFGLGVLVVSAGIEQAQPLGQEYSK